MAQVLFFTGVADKLAFTQRLLTQDANVRNIKAFFSVKRAKFDTRLPLPMPRS